MRRSIDGKTGRHWRWRNWAGHRFGRLVAVSYDDTKQMWLCNCDCGLEHRVRAELLVSGRTKSCGCLKAIRLMTHGNYKEALYFIWRGIVQRCREPNYSQYRRYGGRGIQVCDAWANDYRAFAAHMGERPSLAHSVDRINNDGHYEPGNVRWATAQEQSLNRRTTKMVVYKGQRYSLLQLAKQIAAECEIPPDAKSVWAALDKEIRKKSAH